MHISTRHQDLFRANPISRGAPQGSSSSLSLKLKLKQFPRDLTGNVLTIQPQSVA